MDRLAGPLGNLARALGLALALLAAAANGQSPATSQPAAEAALIAGTALDAANLEARLAAAEASTDLSAEGKARVLEQYRAALAELAKYKEHNDAAAEFRRAIDEAPKQAAAIRARLEQAAAPTDPPVKLDKGAKLAEVEQLLAREQAEVAALEARLAALRQGLDDEAVQQPNQRRRLAEVRQSISELESQLAEAPRDGQEAAARALALEARRDALRAEALMLDQRLLSADARRQLDEARRDEAESALKRAQARQAWLQAEVERRRRDEAEQVRAETEAAQAAAADAHPAVRDLAAANAALAATIDQINQQIAAVEAARKTAEETRARVEQDFQLARQRLQVAGMSRVLGRVLLDQREQLPDLRTLNRDAARRADAIAEATLNQLRWREELGELAAGAATLYAATLEALPPQEAEALLAQLDEQVRRRTDLLRRARTGEERLLRALADLDVAAEALRVSVAAYNDFLAERLLWVRSHGPITQQSFAALPGAVLWVLSPANWLQALRVLAREAPRTPLFWVGMLVVALLLARQGALRRRIRATAEPLRRVSTDHFRYTLQGIGLTLLVALPGALALVLVGALLSGAADADEFSKGVGSALLHTALALYYLRAFRVLCLPGGVADRHFRWSAATLRQLRLDLNLATFGLLPIAFVASLAHQASDPAVGATLGRLALAAFPLGLAALVARTLHPTRGVVKDLLAERPTGLGSRLRWLWYPTVVALPLSLGLLALAGYQYTAGVMLNLLIGQLWLALGLVVLQQAIVRWLLVTRRSLALKATRERRAQRDAARGVGDGPPPGGDRGAEEEAVDLAALDHQTRRLVNASLTVAAVFGLWWLWSDVLPALHILERVTLWTYSLEVDGAAQTVPVTLADLGVVLITVAIATIAVRNLPALIEIVLLKHTSVSAGGRYTITTLTGYLITAVAVLLVVGRLGLNWGQVQWLVAALGVGIGFGLQEIVANFISGLIILFERPVRVGDIVTVGETTGVVTKIEIRATTIRNWDRQELLVPNKEFITGRLLNWTLTDQVNRITIPVGVDYGTDTRRATQVLAEVAAGHPQVLADPAPLITFEGFGDNTLNLVLRCFLESMDGRLDVTTELHHRILERFAAEGIQIAYPQRDVHLNTKAPLEVVWRPGAPAGTADLAGL